MREEAYAYIILNGGFIAFVMNSPFTFYIKIFQLSFNVVILITVSFKIMLF